MRDDDPFCNPFDALLAAEGPPGLFLRDPEGKLRFDAEWTRDAWGRAPIASRTDGVGWTNLIVRPPSVVQLWVWVLARDVASGHVQLVLATSPDLVADHPRLQFRTFPTREAAEAALVAVGRPPVLREPW